MMNIPAEPHFPVTPRRRRAPRSTSSRHRNYTVPVGRVTGHCTTPFLSWKFNDALSPAGGAERQHRDRVSSRKLAASLWRLRLSGSDCGPANRSGTRCEFDCGMVEHSLDGEMKVVDDKEVNVSAQVFEAEKRIRELESEQHLYRKQVVRLQHKLEEERALGQRREREKICLLIDNLRIEKHKSSLVSEVAKAKIEAKKAMQNYEQVRRGRELMEEICKELAKEIGQERAKMEEERKMLEMADAWREERVQMKLADAKVAVEDKYGEMNRLVKELEAFLQMKSKPRGATELRRVTLMRHAVRSVNIRDMKQLSLAPPPLESDHTPSMTQDLRQGT